MSGLAACSFVAKYMMAILSILYLAIYLGIFYGSTYNAVYYTFKSQVARYVEHNYRESKMSVII